MYSASTFSVRDASPHDVSELVRLGWSTEDSWPSGQILVGEIGGVVAAALAIDEDRCVVADVPGAPYLLAHLRARGAGIQAFRRTPSVAQRIRERMGWHITVSV